MDLEKLSSFYADDVVYVLNGAVIARTKTDLIQALSALRSGGFERKHLVSISARANVVTFHGYNTYTDGHTVQGGEMALFNDEGKVIALSAMTPEPTVLGSPRS